MSLGTRALVAVVLLVGFYLIAIVAVIGLLALVAFLGTHVDTESHSMGIVSAVMVVALGLVVIILWSALPRWDRFRPPGPELLAATHPRLFAVLEGVARATGQEMPRHVYATLELNASVTQRGGMLGIGSKRVLVLGLPLLRALSTDELRGVLAHEMGHFAAGDTKLAPWIYKARTVLLRIYDNITKLDGLPGHEPSVLVRVLRAPVHWLLLRFMRVTEAISRAQELAADALAAEVVGKRATIAGLEKVEFAAIAFEVYVRSELQPVLAVGVVPPIGEGFAQFLEAPKVTERLADAVKRKLADPKRTPYDSHPPLADRIAAVAGLADKAEAYPGRAIELVGDAGALELGIFQARAKPPLEVTTWDAVPAAFEKHWRESTRNAAERLATIRTDAIPIEPALFTTLCPALAVILLDEGFTLTARLAEPTLFRRGELTIDLFDEVYDLLAGDCKPEMWNARWVERGLPVRALG